MGCFLLCRHCGVLFLGVDCFIALRFSPSTWITSWSIVTSSLVATTRVRPPKLQRDRSPSGCQAALATTSSSSRRHSRPTLTPSLSGCVGEHHVGTENRMRPQGGRQLDKHSNVGDQTNLPD